jgi:Flp pilus assembly protein TadD
MSLRLRIALAFCALFGAVFLSIDGAMAPAQTAAKSPAKDIPPIQSAAQSLAAGDLKAAENTLNLILQATPDDFRALNLLGIVRAEQHRDLDAENLFKHALELKPDFASAHVSLGMLYVQMSKPDDAISQLQEAFRIDPGRADARVSLISVLRDQAHAAVRENDPEKALSLLLQARKTSPKDADVQYDFGMVALNMSLLPDAQVAFKTALELRKNDPNTLYALGRTQMAFANFEDAHTTFDRYNQLRPSDASGHYASGMTLEALQRPAEARSQFEKSIELQPAQTESYFQLGRMAAEEGDIQAAHEQFARVLNRDAHHAGALAAEGRLKFQQKDYAAAAELLSQAIAANTSLQEAHYYLGMTYARMNRKEDSDKELALASQLEHEEVEKHQNLIRIIDPDQAAGAENKK